MVVTPLLQRRHRACCGKIRCDVAFDAACGDDLPSQPMISVPGPMLMVEHRLRCRELPALPMR